MKKFIILLIGVLVLVACKKSNNNIPVTPSSLAGTWALQLATSTTYKNGSPDSTSTSTYNTTAVGVSNLAPHIYFSADFTGTYLQPGLAGLPFTYTLSGNNLTYTFTNSTVVTTTIQPTIYTIKTLTKTQLILQYGTSAGNGVVYEDVYIKD